MKIPYEPQNTKANTLKKFNKKTTFIKQSYAFVMRIVNSGELISDFVLRNRPHSDFDFPLTLHDYFRSRSMQIAVHVKDKYASTRLQGNLADILMVSLAKFRGRVRDVTLILDDINGPKGGLDKQCKVIVKLKRRSPVVIKDRDSNIGNLVRRVVERTAYTIGQKIDEHRVRSRRKASVGKQASRRESMMQDE